VGGALFEGGEDDEVEVAAEAIAGDVLHGSI
jgi:hypothetical protein